MGKTFKHKSYIYSSIEDEEWKALSDKKAWHRPNSKFKRRNKQGRKAKEKAAFRNDPDNVPEFPKTDQWDWL